MANTMSAYGSNTNRPLSEIVGLSTDTKPTDSIEGIKIQNGSSFRELDTGKKFLFDAENTTWNEVSSGGGGGGGSTLIEKSISANGVYNASEDSADGYSKVTVDVANSYTAEDEGKVVDNGALVAQTAMTEEITENGTVDTTLYSSVTVNVPSGGGTSQPRKDVNFYDYDGTIVNSYTAAEFANLTAMPSNPSHEGLIAQGWNCDELATAKSYVSDYGKLDLGQVYTTSDGKTRLYVDLLEEAKSPVLRLYLYGNTTVNIDWGDGSAISTLSGTSQAVEERHNYASGGKYVISIEVNGTMYVTGYQRLFTDGANNNSYDIIYKASIYKVEIGDNVTQINDEAFRFYSNIESITIPKTVKLINGSNTFATIYKIKTLIIPWNTSLGNTTFRDLYVENLILPLSATTVNNASNYSLREIIIPNSVTSIPSQAFMSCPLYSIIIPSSVTSIASDSFPDTIRNIIIHKEQGSISGSPWGATNATVTWTG